ncbi:MAG: cation:proton antiporter [Synechococcaceae cyanobacterium]|nr:cation:proton antiporter [Synechococcaceae cyanobacterium]
MASPTLLTTLLILLIGLVVARLSSGPLARWAVPAIVLEMAVGVGLGNTILPYSHVAPLSGLMELGVLTLFFQVGLEVRGDLLSSRPQTVLRTVALSCLTPLLAYWPLRACFGLAIAPTLLALAVLSATGTGVTLRVLAQRRALRSPSGRLLVGVSVLDDLPAIGLLTVASAVGGKRVGAGGFGGAGLLLAIAAAALSYWAVDRWARSGRPAPQSPLAILMLLIGSAWLGEASGLTSLLGALWGGVLLGRLRPVDAEVERVLALLAEVFLPLYFLSVGLRLPMASVLEPRAWSLAAVLTALAMLSKLACGLAIRPGDRAAGIDPWLVVFGLMPRGLPGLVFASTALSSGLITTVQFAALVLMVTFTTVVGLWLLDRRLVRIGGAATATPNGTG